MALLLAGSAVFAANLLRTVTLEPKSEPESIAAAPDGSLFLGSASKPVIYRAGKGESEGKIFIDASAEGDVFFLGVLADAKTHSLWACQLGRVPDSKSLHSILRSFDLTSGAGKFRWPLPGDNNLCNDFTLAGDGTLYVSDTRGGSIYRVRPTAQAGDLLIEDQALKGIDGITFLDGVMYVNNVRNNTLLRIPLDASGKAGNPQPIVPDQPLKGPDGMRAAQGKLFLAENAGGRVDLLTIEGDKAKVTVLLEGLVTPTAVEPAGDVLWIGDRGADEAVAIPLPE
jgi:streptogramin lyase